MDSFYSCLKTRSSATAEKQRVNCACLSTVYATPLLFGALSPYVHFGISQWS